MLFPLQNAIGFFFWGASRRRHFFFFFFSWKFRSACGGTERAAASAEPSPPLPARTVLKGIFVWRFVRYLDALLLVPPVGLVEMDFFFFFFVFCILHLTGVTFARMSQVFNVSAC